MKATELRQLSRAEIVDRIEQEGELLQGMRFKLATSQLTNTSLVNQTKKNIARMKTVLKEWDNSGETKQS